MNMFKAFRTMTMRPLFNFAETPAKQSGKPT